MAARKMPKIKRRKYLYLVKLKLVLVQHLQIILHTLQNTFELILDQKEISYILKKYIKDNIKDKDLVKKYLSVPDYHFTTE